MLSYERSRVNDDQVSKNSSGVKTRSANLFSTFFGITVRV